MAHDIEDVWSLCNDIKTDLNQLTTIKNKIDELEQGTRIEMEFCSLCQGTGYYTKAPAPGEPSQQFPCYICDRRGWKQVRKGIDADKLDQEFPQK